MKYLREEIGPDFVYLCECGTEFAANPCTEDNTHWTGKVLVPECPNCRMIGATPPFNAGDRVEYPAHPQQLPSDNKLQGTVMSCAWSPNEQKWSIRVYFDYARDQQTDFVHEFLEDGGAPYKVRRLDAVEALGRVKLDT